MDLSKVAKEMMDFQTKLVVFEKRSNETKDLLTRLLKENIKLEKKLEKETDEIEILYMKLRIEYNKKMIHQIEEIYKNSVETLDEKEKAENEK
ncbi:MAG: hypothetical protein IJ134_04615 [Bacilli bacterium]|nr:hypothetical protein [Bacilli bacterium]